VIGTRIGSRQGTKIGSAVGGDEIGSATTETTTLTVVLTDSADPVNGGANFDYSIAVENVGAHTATNVSAVLTLDAGATFVSGSGTGWTVNHAAGVVTCTRAALAVGAAPTITITVTAANVDDTLASSVVADASNTDAVNDSENTVTVGQTTLTVSIADSADSVVSAADFTYSVAVTNTGANEAANVSCVVDLDAALTYVSASGTGWAFSETGGTVTCTRAALAVGAAPTITITATSPDAADTLSTTADADADNAPAAAQDTEATTVLYVPKDATSGKRVPLSQADWDNVFTLTGVSGKTVAHSHGFQEASGNAAATVGTTYTVNGTLDYQQAVAGWSRYGQGLTETANERQGWASGAGVNPTDNSVLVFAYIDLTGTPAATRNFLVTSLGATPMSLRVTTGPLLSINCAGVTANGTANPTTGGVRPFVSRYDLAASVAAAYSDQEKVGGTFSAGVVDGAKGIGVAGGTPPPMTVLWDTWFEGSHAEWSEANIKTVLEFLGWTIPW